MQGQYQVVKRNGREEGPISESEVADLYRVGQLGDDSRVFDLSKNQWRDLRETFPAAPWRRPGTTPTPWEAPTSGLGQKEERRGPYGLDWAVAGGFGLFFLLLQMAGSQGKPPHLASDAEATGYACGQFVMVLLGPVAYLVVRRWWSRVKALLACGGCLALPMFVGLVSALVIPALVKARDNDASQGETLPAVPAPEPLPSFQRAQVAPWLSLELPGLPTEGTPPQPSLMVASSTHYMVTLPTYQAEVVALDMVPGFRVSPAGALKEQRQLLIKAGIPAAHISDPTPIRVAQGTGFGFTYWTQDPHGRAVNFSRLAVAFPGGSVNPTRGLVLSFASMGSDAELKGLVNRTLASIRYEELSKPKR